MNDPKKLRAWAQLVLSATLLVFCVWIIGNEASDSVKLKWAFGIIGIIIGYWLK
jgi:hypothetical protein